ncbi:hypothetical protein A6R68_16735, partial [Neotoma lepida]
MQGYVIVRIHVCCGGGGLIRPFPQGASYGKPGHHGVNHLKFAEAYSLFATAHAQFSSQARGPTYVIRALRDHSIALKLNRPDYVEPASAAHYKENLRKQDQPISSVQTERNVPTFGHSTTCRNLKSKSSL